MQGGDAGAGVPDVRVCLRSMRQEVLQGCRITFSQIMNGMLKARPQLSAFWQLATSLGAQCCDHLDAPAAAGCSSIDHISGHARGVASSCGGKTSGQNSGTDGEGQPPTRRVDEAATERQTATHVVSLSRLTEKAQRAKERKGVALVSPDWLLASEIKCAHSRCFFYPWHWLYQSFSVTHLKGRSRANAPE